ncbi:hypothetical protein BOTBODRAFT_180375 [Botryobasidium botryosum FD-172 SS1]|uniref:PIN domain-containing protein n=1 Tax=Botryobasidium botryosum (strain FD-172 SS1) TaxID=930990 RepID=A0A067M8D2_BOTB1|nr:hypothetical protein BOTBODRAFT_180375 [Botryobasidium botryosum FD-172 SS1]
MARALGAAFLSHQVEELEHRVSGMHIRRNSSGGGGRGGRGGGRGGRGSGRVESAAYSRGSPEPNRFRSESPPQRSYPSHRGRGRGAGGDTGSSRVASPTHNGSFNGRGATSISPRKTAPPGRSLASTIVVDASVLVYALGQIRSWCREDRHEEIIIPLEALNTLDLLKKGSSQLAQRARAASRVLEEQVGANPRIKVQRDAEFVLWDDVFRGATILDGDIEGDSPGLHDKANGDTKATRVPVPDAPAPEWMRQVVCCALWEIKRVSEHTGSIDGTSPIPNSSPRPAASSPHKRAVLAIIEAAPISPPSSADIASANGRFSHTGADDALMRYSARADGTLVRMWAPYFGVEVLSVGETPSGVRNRPNTGGREVDAFGNGDEINNGGGGRGGRRERERSHAGHSERGHGHGHGRGGGDRGGRGRRRDDHRDRDGFGLVEKVKTGLVPAPAVGQIRLLARGEKLDP